jgi:hypothetical protein
MGSPCLDFLRTWLSLVHGLSSLIMLDNAISFQSFTEIHFYCLGLLSVGIKYLKAKKILYVSALAVETSLRNVMNPLRCQLNYAFTTPLI